MIDKRLQPVASVTTRYAALLSLLLGAAAATGFAPLDYWPVTLACFAGWMWLVHQSPSLKQALLRGWAFGVGHFTIGNNWIQQAFTFQDAMPHWLGYFAVVLVGLYLAVYPMLAAGLAWRLASPRAVADAGTPPGAGFALVFAAAWIATEWLRATMLTGYPWDPLGVIWLPLSPVAWVARLVGTYALSGITVAVAGAMLVAVHRQWRFPVATFGTVVVLALAATMSSGGLVPGEGTKPLRVRIVQPNLGEEERPGPDYADNNLRALEALAGSPGPAPRLIVWPEGALRFQVEDGYPPEYYWQGSPLLIRSRIASRIGPRDIVLAGGNALRFDDKGQLVAATNSVFALDAAARLRGRYDKALLGAIGLSRLVPGDIDFADGPGPGRGLVLPDFGNIGMDICYEIIFSGNVVDKAHRPRLIFNPSNDSWFGSWGPPQHLAQARLRAIEEGLPILRATPTGISAIISADGRLLAFVPPHTAGAIELPLPEAHPPTLFAKLGNWMATLVAMAMLFLAVAIRRAAR